MKTKTKLYQALDKANRRNLTLRQLMLLIKLQDDSINPKDIAKQLGVSGAAVTIMVDRMDKLGLISREHGSTDRRQIVINITPKGQQMCDDIN